VPERPDLEYQVPILNRELANAVIEGVRVAKPVVLRVVVRGKVEELLPGRRITRARRRAHFVVFSLEGAAPSLDLVISPMLAGRFVIAERGAPSPRDLAFVLELAGGRELRYRDDVQMGKVYVTAAGDVASIPGFAKIGIDVLDTKRFTLSAFRELARTRRDQAKVFLMDKSALDAMGNAYADEVLFEARIHPKAMVRSLAPEAIGRLHAAIVKVIGDACRTIAERKPPLEDKLRDFLKVRGHPGEPCPRCGATLRRAGVHGHDAIFCPICQPDVRGSAIVDWGKIPTKVEASPPAPESPKPPRARAKTKAATPSESARSKPKQKRGAPS
jgi:formamidopyrimidine-DNA glycosylase